MLVACARDDEGSSLVEEEVYSPFLKCCLLRWPRHWLGLGLQTSLVFVLLACSLCTRDGRLPMLKLEINLSCDVMKE